jgi:thymidylate synthase (FAD)
MLKVNILSLRYQEAADEFYIPDEWRKQDIKNRQNSVGGENWNPVIYPAEENVDVESRTIYNSPDVTATEVFEGLTKNEFAVYEKLVDAGIAKEMARMVLGTNLYTYMYTQGDLNNLTKFFRLRCHEHCQFETRVIAEGMYSIFKDLFPVVAECYEKYQVKMVEK